MTDNELKVIRQNIACPQFGDDHYGAWGSLNLDQRRTIYKMWDELNRQKAEIERLKSDVSVSKDAYTSMKDRYEYEKEKVEKAKQKCIGIAKALQTAKAEAIKECIKTIKEKLRDLAKIDFQGQYCYLIAEAFFNNILDEVVGEE